MHLYATIERLTHLRNGYTFCLSIFVDAWYFEDVPMSVASHIAYCSAAKNLFAHAVDVCGHVVTWIEVFDDSYPI